MAKVFWFHELLVPDPFGNTPRLFPTQTIYYINCIKIFLVFRVFVMAETISSISILHSRLSVCCVKNVHLNMCMHSFLKVFLSQEGYLNETMWIIHNNKFVIFYLETTNDLYPSPGAFPRSWSH